MKRINRSYVAALMPLVACAPGDQPPPQEADAPPITIVFETNLGEIVAELDADAAPETVRHFVTHVRSRFYDGVVFHRVESGFVIQAGGWQPDGRERKTSAFPIANENPNGLSNVRGTIAMARQPDPHSALVDFFINLVDNQSKLDFRDSTAVGFGYVVFGTITAGMDVVDSIARIPTRVENPILRTYPVEDVVIARAYLRQEPS